MPFLKRYDIHASYLPNYTKRRSGQLIAPAVKFIVAHDTGNPGSTAQQNVTHYANTAQDVYASAHLFVDDREIIECIPATGGPPEKAWHVRYDVPGDNQTYGDDANDIAIGVEYCFGPNINADEAYKRYVWLLAFLCDKFSLNPSNAIIGHFALDPTRRTDPKTGLAASGRTYEKLLTDVVAEYELCRQSSTPSPLPMRLIKNPASNKIYAIGADGKKHWIFNEETFLTGKAIGMWGDWSAIETVTDDPYAEGHMILLVK